MVNKIQRAIGIPEPTNKPDALWRTTQALKEAVELLQGTRGNRAAVIQSELDKTLNDLQVQIDNSLTGNTVQYAAPTSAFGLADASGVQAVFPAAIDTFTLAANSTYEFEGTYIFATGTVSKTVSMAFALTTAVVTNIRYTTIAWNGADGVMSSTQRSKRTGTVASVVVTDASATAAQEIIFRGIVRVTTGGTVTPQIAFSTAPGGTNQITVGSYIKFSRLGTDTAQSSGGWA